MDCDPTLHIESPLTFRRRKSVRYAAGELVEADLGYDLQSLSRSNALGNGGSLYQSRSMRWWFHPSRWGFGEKIWRKERRISDFLDGIYRTPRKTLRWPMEKSTMNEDVSHIWNWRIFQCRVNFQGCKHWLSWRKGPVQVGFLPLWPLYRIQTFWSTIGPHN